MRLLPVKGATPSASARRNLGVYICRLPRGPQGAFCRRIPGARPSPYREVMRRRAIDALPLISTWDNGDRLVGFRLPLSRDLYDAGTPPVWGLAKRPAPSGRVSSIQVGDRLQVARVGRHWVVSDAVGELGWLRWQGATHGKLHPVSGHRILLPTVGVLHVRSLLVSPEGTIKDISGYVEPSGAEP